VNQVMRMSAFINSRLKINKKWLIIIENNTKKKKSSVSLKLSCLDQEGYDNKNQSKEHHITKKMKFKRVEKWRIFSERNVFDEPKRKQPSTNR
jgi:hypothetical protein